MVQIADFETAHLGFGTVERDFNFLRLKFSIWGVFGFSIGALPFSDSLA